MTDQNESGRVRRAVRGGGPVAAITAAIGVGATGIAGESIESQTGPVATEAARAVGLESALGPSVLLVTAVLVLGVALVVPGLFEGHLT